LLSLGLHLYLLWLFLTLVDLGSQCRQSSETINKLASLDTGLFYACKKRIPNKFFYSTLYLGAHVPPFGA